MANDFAIQITADDAATQIIQKVNQALEKLGTGTDKVTKRTKGMADQSRAGLGKLEDAFKKVERSASLVVDKIVEIVPGLAAIGGLASIGGIGVISERFASFGNNLSNSARLVGMNTRELMKFEYAARRAGQSSESIVSTIGSMQDTIRSAALGKSPEAMAQLSGWGINLKRNPDGSVANMNDVVLQVMDKIGAIHSAPAQRYAAGLFGATGSLPMIEQGTYRSDMARADRTGLVPSDADIDKGEQLKQKIVDLQSQVDVLIVKIGSALMPIVGPLVDKFSQMLSANNGRIAGQIADAVQSVVDWAKNIDWSGLIASAKAFFDAIGGLKGIFMAIVAYKITGVIASLVSFGAQMSLLTTGASITAGAVGTVATAVSGLGILAAAAALVINKIKDSTEPGHYVPRGPGYRPPAEDHPGPTPNQSLWDRIKAGWKETGHFVPRTDRNAHGTTSGADPDLAAMAQAQKAQKAAQSGNAPAAAATAATAPATAAATAASGYDLPLGVSSNNPLNIQPNGQEALYASAEDGIAAATANLRKNYRGLTLEQIADKWTGGARTGNTPLQRANYLALLTKGTGLNAGAVPDLNNQQIVAAMLTRQIQAENGTNHGSAWYTPEQVAAGVARGFNGAPAMVGTTGASSATDIRVTFDNVPKGARVEARTSDGAWMPTRINYSLSN